MIISNSKFQNNQYGPSHLAHKVLIYTCILLEKFVQFKVRSALETLQTQLRSDEEFGAFVQYPEIFLWLLLAK